MLKFSDFETNKIKEETEGSQYLQKLQNISEMTAELMRVIGESDELEAWIQDKITIAEHNIDAILNYYKSTKSPKNKVDAKPKSGKLIIDKH